MEYILSEELEGGVDECGRGSLIHDVVAACVVLPTTFENDKYKQIKDSKKLSSKKREELAEYIKSIAITYGIGTATSEEIDDVNILQATMKAMHRAINNAYKKHPFNKLKIDGPHFKPFVPPGYDTDALEHECIIKGDASHLGIAAASIIAKDYHDKEILKLLEEYPDLNKYGLKKNKGYGTVEHRDAIKKYGITKWHRKTFSSCK